MDDEEQDMAERETSVGLAFYGSGTDVDGRIPA